MLLEYYGDFLPQNHPKFDHVSIETHGDLGIPQEAPIFFALVGLKS